MSTEYSRLLELLDEIQTLHPEVVAAALLDSNGLMIASTLDKESELDDILAAEAARLWESTLKAADGLTLGEPFGTFLFSRKGNLLVEPVDQDRMVVFLLKRELRSQNLYIDLSDYLRKFRQLKL